MARGYNRTPGGGSGGGGAVATPTKRVTMNVGADGSGGSSAFSDLLFRPGIQLPVTTTRWRLRIANRATTGPISGALTITPIHLAVPAFANGAYKGVITSTTQALAAPTMPSDGSEVITAWVTDPTLQFQADTPHALNYGVTTAGGITLSKSSNPTVCWYSAGSAAQLTTLSPTGSITVSDNFLDLRLEYETVTNLPVVLCVSDSTGSGQIDDLTLVSGFPGPCATWIGAAGLRHRFLWVNASVAANPTSMFSSSSVRYTRFDLATTVPDAAIINTGINDAAVYGVTASQFTTDYTTTISFLRSLGIKRIYGATVIPQPQLKAGQLTASSAASATTIQTSIAFASGDVVEVGNGTSRAETKTLAAASTGTVAPFTTTIPALTNAHPQGEAIGITKESLRRSYNRALRAGYPYLDGVFDFDLMLRDPVNPYTIEADLIGTGTVHPGFGAYARMADAVVLPRTA